MSAFKDNLEEQRQRHKYQKENFWAIFSISFLFGIVALSFLGFSEQSWITYFIYIPNLGATYPFYVVGLLFLLWYRWWWKGIPKYILILLSPLYKSLIFLKNKFKKNKLIYSIFEGLSINKFTRRKLVNGKEKELNRFFYPKSVIVDGLPRKKNFKYLRNSIYHIGNLFDYNAQTFMVDEEGTNRIISFFRDAKMEKLKDRSLSFDEKVSARAKELIKKREQRYVNRRLPSPEQEEKYKDLFEVVEGVLSDYDGKTDGVKISNFKSPLQLSLRNGSIHSVSVDESIDVFVDGKVYFSLRMIVETTQRMTILFMQFMKKNMSRNSRFSSASSSSSVVLSDKKNLKLFEDYFKIVFFRRLLSNYGSIPSGWMCVRIEDYTLRAIMSAVDRPLIPTITSTNDGSNNFFQSDVLSTAFLFSYWAFMHEPLIIGLVDDVEWCFNTTKDLNEIKARSLAKEGMGQ